MYLPLLKTRPLLDRGSVPWVSVLAIATAYKVSRKGKYVDMRENIVTRLDDHLLTITLNLPDRRNALNTEVALELLAAVRRAQSASDVRAVLFRGEGGTFCVGGDVKGMADSSKPAPSFEEKNALMHETMQIGRILHEMAKPIVAAIDGAAAGAGLSLALACDFRVVGEGAKITTAFARMAVAGDYGGIYYLTKLIGSAKARELYLLCPVISGRDAHALGLATRLVPDDMVQSSALELARSLAAGPPLALGYIKRNLNNAEDMSLEAYLEVEALHQCRCLQSSDYKEAAAAFVAKRRPQFTGA